MSRAGFRLTDPRHFLALGFGLGLAPVAPGSFGTLAALPLLAVGALLPLAVYAAMTAAAALFGIWLCGRVAAEVGVPDHPAIVWDEVAGMLVAALPWVAGVGRLHPLVDLLVLLALFRLFDTLKPWPIRALERRLAGGLGIVADDLAAGAAAAALWGGMTLGLGRLAGA